MSIEQKLDELTAAVLKNTETAMSLIAALGVTAANQERLILGQTKAIEVATSPEGKATTRRRSKPADEPAVTEPAEAVVEAASEPAVEGRVVTEDEVRVLAAGWLKSATDPEVRKEVGEFLSATAANFGRKKLLGPVDPAKPHLGEGITDPAELKQAWFFISRKQAGLPVDFGADYDFDGGVDQGGSSDDDDFDIG